MSLHRLSFPSNIEQCGLLRSCIRAFGRSEGFGEEFLSSLELCVHEAFVNAVVHGNGGDSALTVTVTMRTVPEDEGGLLLVEVADCGPGFDLAACVAPAFAGRYLRLSGRGMPIILNYAQSARVEPLSGGSVLRLAYIPF